MHLAAGWHSRGYLPHFDDGVSAQCVTYRLHDALPVEVLARMKEAACDDEARRLQIELFLDSGHGSCVLRTPRNAQTIVSNWQHFDGDLYHLPAWVVMPNHVHLLIEPTGRRSLSRIVGAWKSYTAKVISRSGGGSRPLWQPDFWDRFIRNRRHLLATMAYIHQNPVRAGLCRRPEDWAWSSAHPGARAARPLL